MLSNIRPLVSSLVVYNTRLLVPIPSYLQADFATLSEDKSTLNSHPYSRAGVIKPGTYSRSLLRSSIDQKLVCARCNAVHSLGIDHYLKHDRDKYGKAPQKLIRR